MADLLRVCSLARSLTSRRETACFTTSVIPSPSPSPSSSSTARGVAAGGATSDEGGRLRELSIVTSEGTLSLSRDALVLGVVSRGVDLSPSMSDSAPLSSGLGTCRGGEGCGVVSLEFTAGAAGTITGCCDRVSWGGGGLETTVACVWQLEEQ